MTDPQPGLLTGDDIGSRSEDITGRIFGQLTVLRYAGTLTTQKKRKRRLWVCACTCGTECTVEATQLQSGHTRSCGCLQKTPAVSPMLRFLRKVDTSGDCWLWTASTRNGYGQFRATPQLKVEAHRWMYEQLVGPIPTSIVIDHLCCVPLCVNPSHMEPVTDAENKRRGMAAMTHCPKGHRYTEANTLRTPSGHKRCAACVKERIRPSRKTDRDKAMEFRALKADVMASAEDPPPEHIRQAYPHAEPGCAYPYGQTGGDGV